MAAPKAAAGVVGAVAITAILVVPSTGLALPGETTQDVPSAPDPWFATVDMDRGRPMFPDPAGSGTSPWTSRGPAAAGQPPTGSSGPARSARVSAPSPEIRPRRARPLPCKEGIAQLLKLSAVAWSLTTLSARAISWPR